MLMQRKRAPARVDVARDAVEAIALESFRPAMRREVVKGERLPRDAELVRAFPQFFGLLLPLTEINRGG
jgi:hypothetical protein